MKASNFLTYLEKKFRELRWRAAFDWDGPHFAFFFFYNILLSFLPLHDMTAFGSYHADLISTGSFIISLTRVIRAQNPPLVCALIIFNLD